MCRGPDHAWRLTFRERKRILLDHVFGVDIDRQAVEVTRRALLLKLVEEEPVRAAGGDRCPTRGRTLPDLSDNIKCGNALIGPDFYDGAAAAALGAAERRRIRAFDWAAEFPGVFRCTRLALRRRSLPSPHAGSVGPELARRGGCPTFFEPIGMLAGHGGPALHFCGGLPGPRASGKNMCGPDVQCAVPQRGFDVVIGNPPYLSFSGRQAVRISTAEREYFRRRYRSAGWLTAHGMFIEAAVGRLARRYAAFVVPDQVGHLAGYAPVRALLVQHAGLREVRYWGEGVFAGAVTPALTFVADRSYRGSTTIVHADGRSGTQCCADGDAWGCAGHAALLAKVRLHGVSLGRLVGDPGVHTGNSARRLIVPLGNRRAGCVPVLQGRQVSRYRCEPPRKALKLDYDPQAGEYFRIGRGTTYAAARFVIRQTAPFPIVGPRVGARYFRNSLLALYGPREGTDVRYLVGILNSRLMRYVYTQTVHESRQRAFPQVKVRALRELPIRMPNRTEPREAARHDRLVRLVQQMLELHRSLAVAQTPRATAALQRRIDATDRRIDRLVYRLYGLTTAEMQAVDDATR